MCKGTLCPILFISDPSSSIEKINEEFIEVTRAHIDKCLNLGIQVEISADVWDRTMQLFPWSLQSNDRMRQYVDLWLKTVITPIQRYCKIIHSGFSNKRQTTSTYNCDIDNDCALKSLWDQWLNHWSNSHKIKNKIPKGIGISSNCCSSARPSICNAFIIVIQATDWECVKFPFYLKYPRTLPAQGEYPFIPPYNWKSQRPQKGTRNGYIDKKGNEWVWDHLHNDHWDVNISTNNGYMKVTRKGCKL